MATVVSLFAKKGGVGKTTIALNLGAYLTTQGLRVLLIDADSQASLSQGLLGPEAVEKLPQSRTIAALFDTVRDPEPHLVISKTSSQRLFLAPASDLLQPFSHPDPLNHGQFQFAFRDFVSEVAADFDVVVCDAPPDCSNLLAWNCLMASQFVISPVSMETYSAQSIAGVNRKIEEALSNGNANLQTLGYVVNLRNKRASLHIANEKRFRMLYGAQVFETVIYDWIATPEAQHKKTHIFDYSPQSEAAAAFAKLGQEIFNRIQLSTMGRAA